MRLTVGPLPPAVYWRRRALVLGGALVALFLVAQACMAVSASPDGQSAPQSPSPSASTPSTPSASSLFPTSATSPPAPATGAPATTAPPADPPDGQEDGESLDPADPDRCTDDEMLVTAVADRESFVPGEESVLLTIRITNDSDRTCRRDVGGDERELSVVRGTGADHVWSSRDCSEPTGSDVRDLAPGIEREHSISFAGRSGSSCDGPAATGDVLEAGEYHVIARLGTDRSEPLPLTLTDG